MQISDPVFLPSYLCRLAISNGKSRGLIRLLLLACLLVVVVLQDIGKHDKKRARTVSRRDTNRVEGSKINVFMPRLLLGLGCVFSGLPLMQIADEDSGKVRGRKR